MDSKGTQPYIYMYPFSPRLFVKEREAKLCEMPAVSQVLYYLHNLVAPLRGGYNSLCFPEEKTEVQRGQGSCSWSHGLTPKAHAHSRISFKRCSCLN